MACPKLQKLEIVLDDLFERLREFGRMFRLIAKVCLDLFLKLGEENFTINVEWSEGQRQWTMADFESGQEPVMRNRH